MTRIAALLLLGLAAFAEAPLPDAAQEAEAQDLMRELRCLVCQGQSIAESNAEMAVDMRALVRERIAEGQEPQEIRNYLIRRYGDWVTFSPPARGTHLILWAAPLVFLLVGGALTYRLFRKRRV
ncbi:cytochrome C biogenesis protein [Pacificimonas flava]|uniref:Cytochrome c-type biogenesis protein n=2 Tax=Pacificimonas TaxID=1960290 RepID=A0A219B4F3_9SPHN|nr:MULTISPECIES: cytochrome c-type biogenesis protein [Pacificimonas]MBZ6379554.1 cytochrome c-type biogenesis protein CcmH [Pacificimonas aurantium]OWV33262.1 cytochrome C biogenesis protein [Pacificimonas flava]